MSGVPLTNSRSANTYRDQYIHNLVLRSKLADANYNGNNFSNGLTITKDERTTRARTAAQVRASIPGAIPVQTYETNVSRRALLAKQLSEITGDAEHVVQELGDLSDYAIQHLQEIVEYILEYYPELNNQEIPEVLIVNATRILHDNQEKTSHVNHDLQLTGKPITGIQQYLLKSGRLYSESTMRKLAKFIDGEITSAINDSDTDSASDNEDEEGENMQTYLAHRDQTMVRSVPFNAEEQDLDQPEGPNQQLGQVLQNVQTKDSPNKQQNLFVDANGRVAKKASSKSKPAAPMGTGLLLKQERKRVHSGAGNMSLSTQSNHHKQNNVNVAMEPHNLQAQFHRLLHFESQFVFLLQHLKQKTDCYPELEALHYAMQGLPSNSDVNMAVNQCLKYPANAHALVNLYEVMDVSEQQKFLDENRDFLFQKHIALHNRMQNEQEPHLQLLRRNNAFPLPSPVVNMPVTSSANTELQDLLDPSYNNLLPPSHSIMNYPQSAQMPANPAAHLQNTSFRSATKLSSGVHTAGPNYLTLPPAPQAQHIPTPQPHVNSFQIGGDEMHSRLKSMHHIHADLANPIDDEDILMGHNDTASKIHEIANEDMHAGRRNYIQHEHPFQAIHRLSSYESQSRQAPSIPMMQSQHVPKQKRELNNVNVGEQQPLRKQMKSDEKFRLNYAKPEKHHFVHMTENANYTPSWEQGHGLTQSQLGEALETSSRPIGKLGGKPGALAEPLLRAAGQYLKRQPRTNRTPLPLQRRLQQTYPKMPVQLPRARGLKGRMKGHGVGIPRADKYVPFGKLYVNKHALIGKGLLMLRRPGGGYHPNYKTTKISGELADCIDNMLQGVVPDYNSLSTEERSYLRKLASTAELDDRLHIPAPPKDKDQAEEDKLEVLIGEIRAGNDSPELLIRVKKILEHMLQEKRVTDDEVKDIFNEFKLLGIL
jgi:hypothetical protein